MSELLGALQALFLSEAGSAAQTAASEWLVDFSESPGAWDAAVELAAQPAAAGDEAVAFAAARMLHGLACSRWQGRCADPSPPQLAQIVAAPALAARSWRLVAERLLLAAAAVAVRASDAAAVLDRLLQASGSLGPMAVSLAVAEELGTAYLQGHPAAAQAVEALRPHAQWACSAALQTPTVEALRCLHAWVICHATGAGPSLGDLAAGDGAALEVLLAIFRQTSSEGWSAVVDLLEDGLAAPLVDDGEEYTDLPPTAAAAFAVARAVATLSADLCSAGAPGDSPAWLGSFRVATALVETHSELLWGGEAESIALRGLADFSLEAGAAVLDTLALCVSHEQREIAALPLEALYLSAAPAPECKTQLLPVLGRIVDTLVRQCAIRGDGDYDDAAEFRRTAPDTVLGLARVWEEEAACVEATLRIATDGEGGWPACDAALSVLSALAELTDCEPPSPSASSGFMSAASAGSRSPSPPADSAWDLVGSALCALATQPQPLHPRVLASSARLLSMLAESWLPPRQALVGALMVLPLRAIGCPEAVGAGAEALFQMTAHCTPLGGAELEQSFVAAYEAALPVLMATRTRHHSRVLEACAELAGARNSEPLVQHVLGRALNVAPLDALEGVAWGLRRARPELRHAVFEGLAAAAERSTDDETACALFSALVRASEGDEGDAEADRRERECAVAAVRRAGRAAPGCAEALRCLTACSRAGVAPSPLPPVSLDDPECCEEGFRLRAACAGTCPQALGSGDVEAAVAALGMELPGPVHRAALAFVEAVVPVAPPELVLTPGLAAALLAAARAGHTKKAGAKAMYRLVCAHPERAPQLLGLAPELAAVKDQGERRFVVAVLRHLP